MRTDQVCSNCHAEYTEDELYCDECGWILPHVSGDDETLLVRDLRGRKVDLAWGTGYFHRHAKLFLIIPEQDATISIPLHMQSVVIGRAKKVEGESCVNLSSYNAAKLGVSRHHIRVSRIPDGLEVVDLDSSNGTFLNRDRLDPYVPQLLRNHAVLQLGQLMLRVKFA